jgi:hypothetical protein
VGLAAVAVVAVLADATAAALSLAGLLVLVAAARATRRHERAEGLAVRSWPVDVAVSLVLAGAIVVLALGTPGV